MLLTTSPNVTYDQASTTLRGIYRIFADYVLKNPFASPDMPIRCELFDTHVEKFVTASQD